MNLQRKKLRPGRTPHLDPLPFRRGEERTVAPTRGTAAPDESAQPLLSPVGGEAQCEGPTGRTIRRARSLRKKPTWAEKLLWSRLRNRQLAGYKFRRQHSVGPYNLDFYCAQARLAVELDGREHGHPDRQITDKKRDAFLAHLGIKVIRFWNHALRENLRSVLDTILRELAERTPHLDPLPFRRGEEKPVAPAVGSAAAGEPAPSFLSPVGGETSEVVRQRIFHFLLTVLSRFHDQPGVGFQAPLLKSAYVAGLVVRLPFLPHSPHDPLPLVGQLSHRFVVAHPPFEILITTSR